MIQLFANSVFAVTSQHIITMNNKSQPQVLIKEKENHFPLSLDPASDMGNENITSAYH